MFHSAEKTVLLKRDVEGLLIPAGTPILLTKDTSVQITQALGNSLTIYVNGNLVRLYGHDADAVGKNPPPVLQIDPCEQLSEGHVIQALRNIFDPEIPVNIVDLGLIYDCAILTAQNGGHLIHVTMTLTAPGCGMGPILAQDVEKVCKSFPGVEDAHIDVVFDPPWNQEMMSEEARLQLGLI